MSRHCGTGEDPDLQMPTPDSRVLDRRPALLDGLRTILPDGLISIPEAMRVYETDALTSQRQLPLAVALPRTTAEVAAVLQFCHRHQVKVVPRGAGTGLSGGALPLADGVLLVLSRLNRILDVDLANRCVVAQPGVTNLAISQAVAADGFYYAPDPSSQIACSIGGNVAENSGGVHCLKYGVTGNHLLGLECVTMEGEILRLGGRFHDATPYDLIGILTGSEGMLAVVTEVTVRILPRPETARALMLGFPSVELAAAAVAAIIAAGIVPAGIEMMDSLALNAAEDFVQAGYPRNAAALLIVELDGPAVEVDLLLDQVLQIGRHHGAASERVSSDEAERLQIWAGRKAAFPAVGRIAADYLCMDGTIPRHALPEVMRRIQVLQGEFGLRVANVFHAGDGNLHPLILFDANIPGELDRAEAFGAAILRLCVAVGGVLTGEHGVGVEKRDLMPVQFSADDLDQQMRLKCAFDPDGLLNPGKMFPVLRRCAELGRLRVHHGTLPFPDLPRF
jgi:glycolate oxidase